MRDLNATDMIWDEGLIRKIRANFRASAAVYAATEDELSPRRLTFAPSGASSRNGRRGPLSGRIAQRRSH